MSHFVCTGGCQGVSEKPGNCQAQACAKYGKSLLMCACNDGKHTEAFKKENKKK